MEGKCRCGGTLTWNTVCDVCLREQRKRQDERKGVVTNPVAQQIRARVAAMTDDQVVEFWRKLGSLNDEVEP